MAEHELPSDLGDWPHNLYELLGVGHDVQERELKRAYLRLIRKFKPEFFPAHFSRLRQAYELLRDWHSSERNPGDDATELVFPMSREAPRPVEDSRQPDAPCENAGDSIETKTAELWKQAADDPAAAYRGLRELCSRGHHDRDVFMRLYWLLKLQPDADAIRDPASWLTEGMRRTQPSGNLLELYCMEMAANSAEGVTRRAEELLLQEAMSEGSLYRLATSRWACCARLGASGRIKDDLRQFVARLADDRPELTLRLVLAATEPLAWMDDDASVEALTYCRSKATSFLDLQLKYDEALTQNDCLLEMARERRRLAAERPPLVASPWLLPLVPLAWKGEMSEMRDALARAAGLFSDDAIRSLMLLDAFASSAPVSFGQIHQSVRDLCSRCRRFAAGGDQSDEGQENVRNIRVFLDSIDVRQYLWIREPLLKFCLDEHVDPIDFARVVSESDWPHGRRLAGGDLISKIHEDLTLSFVWSARQALTL